MVVARRREREKLTNSQIESIITSFTLLAASHLFNMLNPSAHSSFSVSVQIPISRVSICLLKCDFSRKIPFYFAIIPCSLFSLSSILLQCVFTKKKKKHSTLTLLQSPLNAYASVLVPRGLITWTTKMPCPELAGQLST